MTGYDLSRTFFDWCFENPEKVNTNHVALYFFAIEHCNRLGWKEKFGLPSSMAKDAIGIKSYNTYIKAFNDLVEWGFFKVVEKSRNQYSSNIISLSALSKNNKALDKAVVKHLTKQRESTGESIYTIDKPLTNNNTKPVTGKYTPPPSVDLSKFSKEEIERYSEFEKWFKKEFQYIVNIKNQISLHEFVKLMKRFDKSEVVGILRTMENKYEKCKKNVSVYQTAIDWLRISNKERV